MKKVLKIALLLLAASIFFAGCSNSSGGSSGGSGGSKGKTNSSSKMPQFDLSDGDWDMDMTSYQKMTQTGVSTPLRETTSVDHVELTVAGEDVVVTKATRSVDGSTPVDTTNDWNAMLKDAKDAGNISAISSQAESGSSGSGTGFTASGMTTQTIEPTITLDPNNSDTYYKVTVELDYSFADLFGLGGIPISSSSSGSSSSLMDARFYQKVTVIYTKK